MFSAAAYEKRRKKGGLLAPTKSSSMKKTSKVVQRSPATAKKKPRKKSAGGLNVIDLTKKKPAGTPRESSEVGKGKESASKIVEGQVSAFNTPPSAPAVLTPKPKEPQLKLKGPFAVHKKQTTQLQRQVERQSKDMQHVQAYHTLLRQKLDSSREKYSEMKGAFVKLQAHSEDLRQRLHTSEGFGKSLSETLNERKAQLDSANSTIQDLRERLAVEVETNKELNNRVNNLTREVQTNESEVCNMQNLYDNVEDERDTLLKRVETLDRTIEIMKKDRDRFEKHIAVLRKEKDRAHDELKEMQTGRRAKSSTRSLKHREDSWQQPNTSHTDQGTARASSHARSNLPRSLVRGVGGDSNLKVALKHLSQEEEKCKILEKQLQSERMKTRDLQNRVRNFQRY